MSDLADLVQGSPEWHLARAGKVTASRIADMMATGKSGAPSASRANYLAELVCARLTGLPAESYQSREMMWGNEQEPAARALYGFMTDADVVEVGFVQHPTIEMAGCSPDGLVHADGMVQFKCPGSATHLAYLRGAPIPGLYVKQVQFEMACTGRAWSDFTSYDPRFPADLQLHIRRVPRDPAMVVEIERAVIAFLDEVDLAVRALRPAGAFRESVA